MIRCTVAILAMILLTPAIGEPTGSRVRPEIAEAIERLRSSDRAKRADGLKRLWAAAENARPAWPVLVVILHDPNASDDERAQVLSVLGNITNPEDEVMSRAIVQVALQLMARDREGKHLIESYTLLRRHPRQLRQFVPRLREMLRLDHPSEVNYAAGLVVSLLADCGTEGFGVLVEAVGHRDFTYRYSAVDYLGNFGEFGRPALPVLLDCLGDGKDVLRVRAATALLRIDRRGSLGQAVPVLASLIDSDASNATLALRVLRDLGPDAAASVPALTRALRRPELLPEKLAVLRAIGPAAADAVAEVRELLDRSTDRLVVDIAHTLWCIAPPPSNRLAIHLLIDRAEQGEQRAIRVLGELGRGVPDVWEALLRLHRKGSANDAALLALALWQTAPTQENDGQQWDGRELALDALDELLKRGDFRVFDAIGVIGPGAARLVPRLQSMLGDTNRQLGQGAAIALGEIGPSARSAVPRLWELANNHRVPATFRTEAALAVARIDPACVERVVSLVCRGSLSGGWETIVRLAHFGPRARSAVPRLREMLQTIAPHARAKVADALWRIDPDEARRLGLVRSAPRLGEEARP